MSDVFNIKFYRDYRFWTFFIAILSLIAMAIFAYQARQIQLTLRLIEETRQRETFCDNLQICFAMSPSQSGKPEHAEYDLKLHNKSACIYESLRTTVSLSLQDPKTRTRKQVEVFTFPEKDLPPSDKPLSLVDNPQLIKTFRDNISEAKKNIPDTFKPKHFYFLFQWKVNFGEGKSFNVKKRKAFLIKGPLKEARSPQ